MKLTASQNEVIQRLKRYGPETAWHNNPTMMALKRRGLVIDFPCSPRLNRWQLTDKGRADG